MLNDKESPFTLTLTHTGICLPVLRFSGQEALNQPYRFEVEVIGLGPALAPDNWLQQTAFLQMGAANGIHGVVQSVSREHRGAWQTGFSVVLVPHLQALARPRKRRVYTQMDVPTILHRLLAENRVTADSYRLDLSVGCYPPRPHCVQYEESDLALLQRLCEEEGIHYHFEHRPDGHVLVFADDSLGLPQQSTAIAFNATGRTDEPGISRLFQHHDATPPRVLPAVRNRGQQTTLELAANQGEVPVCEPMVRSPTEQHAEQRTRRQLQRQRCQYRAVHGRSDCPDLRAGHLMHVSEHPISGFNEQWLLTELRHEGQQPSIFDTTLGVRRYHNDFTAQPWSTDFRPALRQPRPNVAGYHLARVAGPPGEAPRIDEKERIAVWLWPCDNPADRQAVWLPVVTTRTDSAVTDLPCAGSEVWVSFLDGDPDRPVLWLGATRWASVAKKEPEPDDGWLLDWLLHPSIP